MSGGRNVFAVARSIWDDSDFAEEPFTEREAWMWLVSAAAWKDGHYRGNAGPADLKRGEFSFSVRFMAEKWKWSKSKVDRFMQRLEKRDTIRDESRDGSQIYSVKNYNHFQVVGLPKRDSNRDSDGDDSGTAAGQQRDKEETGKQGNRETVEEESSLRSAPIPTAKRPRPSPKPEPPGFAEFYSIYPLKKARPAAAKAYGRAILRAGPEVIQAGAERYALARADEDPNFTKHPATWLNNDCWADQEISHATKSSGQKTGNGTVHERHREGWSRILDAESERAEPRSDELDLGSGETRQRA